MVNKIREMRMLSEYNPCGRGVFQSPKSSTRKKRKMRNLRSGLCESPMRRQRRKSGPARKFEDKNGVEDGDKIRKGPEYQADIPEDCTFDSFDRGDVLLDIDVHRLQSRWRRHLVFLFFAGLNTNKSYVDRFINMFVSIV